MPRGGTETQLLRSRPSCKVAHETGIHEEDLGRLGQALVDVGPKRLDDPNDVGRLQNGEPRLNRLVIDIDGVPDVGGVQKLAGSRYLAESAVVKIGNNNPDLTTLLWRANTSTSKNASAKIHP